MNTSSCQSTGFQGYMAQGAFGPGLDSLECQAQLMAGLAMATRSVDSRVPMWRACQPPAPAGNAQTPFPPWNLLPAVQACPSPASAASIDPATPHPTWSWKYSPQPTGRPSPRWGTLWVSKVGHSPHRPSKFKSSSWIFLPPTNNWIILWASNRCILVTCTSLIRSASDVQFKSPSYNNEYLPGAPKN